MRVESAYPRVPDDAQMSLVRAVPPLDDDLHLWKIDLDVSASARDALAATLSADERQRAARFKFDLHRHRFITGRGVLRALLASYLESDPGRIGFTYGPFGKPALADDQHRVRFNVSHAGPLVLIGITRMGEIGVDLERRTGGVDYLSIAQHYFSRTEIADLETLPADQQQDGFLNCWTRKEAFIKARGEGISLPLDRFAVSLRPDAAPAILWSSDGMADVGRWDIRAVDVDANHVAALAVERPCGAAILRDWAPEPRT
jgi:4'-phosphopantetheinyl transferase